MESAHGAAGYRHEQRGEQGLLQAQTHVTPSREAVPHLRQPRVLRHEDGTYGHHHKEHRQSKSGIDASDDLVDGHNGSDDIVGKYYGHPHHLIAPNAGKDDGGAIYEEGPHEHHHQHRE